MLAHQGGDTPGLRRLGHDVAAIAHVCAQRWLIGLDEVGAEDPPVRVASYEGLCRQLYPDVPDLFLGTLRRERIGVASADGLFEDRPGPWPVRLPVLADHEHG